MKKNNNKANAVTEKKKTRRPRHKGINTPKNVHKGFRTRGAFNSCVVKGEFEHESRRGRVTVGRE